MPIPSRGKRLFSQLIVTNKIIYRLPLTAPVAGTDDTVTGLEGDWIRLSNHLAYIRSQKDDAVSFCCLLLQCDDSPSGEKLQKGQLAANCSNACTKKVGLGS